MYATYTRLQVRTDLRSRMGNSIFWTDTELNSAITEAMRTWNLLTGDWGQRHSGITVGTSAFVSLPSTINSTTRMEYVGTPLIQTSLRDLDDGKPGWQSTAGAPKYWAPVALNLIAIYPHQTVGPRAITADGITETPVMTADTDTIDLDSALFDVLLDYARHLLLLKLGGEEFEQSKESRKKLWAMAAKDNQRIQASAPYRRVMGFPLDSTRQPLVAGTQKVGIR